ncbi:MAG: SGNH/GDSL hydrolase family protein [Lentisphaeria bacterium]|nr:SGNH/GDSL hydrolase family protein [Lentisphaeria bacterium]
MMTSCVRILGAALAGAVVAGAAEAVAAPQPPARPAPRPHPSLAPVTEKAGLPRVLLIGDSISMGYTLPVRELLADRANVHRIPTNGGPTSRGVESIEAWLGEGKWNVIHFNWGLHDLKRMEDGNHQVPLAQYEANLRSLAAALKETGAVLIWCSTTPVPEGDLRPPRSNEDVLAYNAAARRVMEENGIQINDLYAFALPRLKEIQLPVNVHFSADGSRVLAEEVARVIGAALKTR